MSGRREFVWQSNLTLSGNQYYELIFWPAGGDPMSQGFGPVGSFKETKTSVDLDKAIEAIPQFEFGKEYEWGVLLVELEPSYRRIAHLATGSKFVVSGAGGGGSGGSSGGSSCCEWGGKGGD